MEAEIAALHQNVDALLRDAERVDAEEDRRFGPDRRGDELPAQLQRRERRLAAIRGPSGLIRRSWLAAIDRRATA